MEKLRIKKWIHFFFHCCCLIKTKTNFNFRLLLYSVINEVVHYISRHWQTAGCESTIVLPILLRREARAAATVTVDLFNSAADIIVADVQHVETRTCAVHQGGAVQKTKTAFCERSLHTQNGSMKSLWKVKRDSMMDMLL